MQNPDLILLDNKIELSQNVLDMLNAKPNDRITIGFSPNNGLLQPLITKDDNGNKLTKSKTFSYRGKMRDMLAQYGTTFIAENVSGTIFLTGDNPEYKVFTSETKAKEFVLDKIVLENKQFKLQINNEYIF